MSHIRNLLYKSFSQENNPSPASGATALVGSVPDNIPFTVTTAAPTRTLQDLPVAEAHVSPDSRLVFHTSPRSATADRFRLLRMRLKEHWKSGKLKKLLITSPLAHDGKSTAILNLATALAERGKHSVLVVDSDLHHSSLAQSLRITPSAGLAECLVDDATAPFSTIRRIEPLGWYLLQAGEPRRNPTELLQTPAFGNILQKLAPCFDWILIDSPPVIPLTDALSLQQHADASLLIVRAGQTPREAVEQTITLLGKQNILGIVLNGVETRNHLYYQYYDSTRHHQED